MTAVTSRVLGVSALIVRDFNAVVSPYIISVNDFRKKREERSPLICEIMGSYKMVYGTPLERLAV